MLLLSRWPFLRPSSAPNKKRKRISFDFVSAGGDAYGHSEESDRKVYLLPFCWLVFVVVPALIVINTKRLQKQLGELQGAEILAAAVVALQFLQFVLHHLRFRRRSHWLLQWGAWVAYHAPAPLAALAVGEMLRLRRPFWPVAVLFAAGQSDTMAACSLDDDSHSMRRFARRTLYLAYLVVALLQGARVPTELYCYSLFAGFLVFLVHLRVSRMATVPSGDICMAAAEAGSSRCSSRSSGSSARGAAVVAVGSLESRDSAISGSTTYEDIVAMGYSERLQDVCLSSALSLQLLQRYHHGSVAVSGANLAFKKLLVVGDYARALKLVEVQLSLMYDHFFSTHGSPSSASYKLYWDHWVYRIGFLMHTLSLVYVKPINNQQANNAQQQAADAAEHGGAFAVGVVYLLVLVELCQIVHYLTSDRFLVSYMCDRARALLSSGHGISSSTCKPLHMAVLNTILETRGTSSWQNTIGQFSLVEDYSACTTSSSCSSSSSSSSLGQRLMGRVLLLHGRWPRRGNVAALSMEEVKAWVLEKVVVTSPADSPTAPDSGSGSSSSTAASEFGSGSGSPSTTASSESDEPSSPASRRRRKADHQLPWPLLSHETDQAQTILTWHIATWICSMRTVHQVLPSSDYMAATKLSSYCAYLVAFHPELLPGGHQHHTAVARRRIFGEAIREAELHLNGETSSYGRYTRFMSAWEQGDFSPLGVLEPGARLARHLKDIEIKGGYYYCWAVIADFWAQMLLHLALSGNAAAAHIEHLAKGGEFLTRLWALLANAGMQQNSTLIIKRRKIFDSNRAQSKRASTKTKKM